MNDTDLNCNAQLRIGTIKPLTHFWKQGALTTPVVQVPGLASPGHGYGLVFRRKFDYRPSRQAGRRMQFCQGWQGGGAKMHSPTKKRHENRHSLSRRLHWSWLKLKLEHDMEAGILCANAAGPVQVTWTPQDKWHWFELQCTTEDWNDQATHTFWTQGALTRFSPFSTRAVSAFQQAAPSRLYWAAPNTSNFSHLNRDSPSGMFESVGLAYQGVICLVHSNATVAMKIFRATTFLEIQEIRVSRTPLLSV